MSNFLKYVIAILVIAAVFLGYQVYRSQTPATTTPAPVAAVDNKPVAQPAKTGTTPATTPVATTPVSGKKVDVQAVLNSPAGTASEAQKQAYAKLVIDSAVPTKSINISSCTPEPTVSTFADKSEVVLVNNDSTEHRIGFDVTTFFIVPANSSKTIKAEFGKGPGIYGFGCDQSQKAVGMVFVTTP